MAYKSPVCVRDEYTIYLQDIEGTCWVHCDVRRWSAVVCRRLRSDWDALFGLLGRPAFALNEPTGDEKHQRFMRLMGFEFFRTLPAKDGGECIVFRREK
jgi:hypothetical protein